MKDIKTINKDEVVVDIGHGVFKDEVSVTFYAYAGDTATITFDLSDSSDTAALSLLVKELSEKLSDALNKEK